MKVIEQLLRERTGLSPAATGPRHLERVVRTRMKALGVQQLADYQLRLDTSPMEWEELLESVVVAETWFFRDRQPFAALARLALAEQSAHPTTPLRLLSVPCATGEEPYSMAMALLDAGIPPAGFHIDAADISARALAAADTAVYRRNSFRGTDLDYRARHFRAVKDIYALDCRVRDRVSFFRGNLLDDAFLADATPYDFIFCRNLLIYFDPGAQTKALGKLARLLGKRGVLFAGASELPFVVRHGFVSENLPMAFACRKASHGHPVAGSAGPVSDTRRHKNASASSKLGAAGGNTSTATLHHRPQELDMPLPHQDAPHYDFGPPEPNATSARTPKRSRSGSDVAARHAAQTETPLEAAQRLADSGALDEAIALCQAHLRHQRNSAQAHYLLGLIADARGLPDAEEYYRKALYLDPHHPEALLHMSLLHTKRCDTAKARIFRQRAERALKRT